MKKPSEQDMKFAKYLFENVTMKHSKLSKSELLEDFSKNYPANGSYCNKCMIGDHKNCRYNKDHRIKCSCKKCRIPKKWS